MTWEVWRDAWGIPHLRADSLGELAHAQGWEVATTRGRQIEAHRRRGEGRLAEAVGPAGVESDVFARRAGLATTACRAYAALDPETRAFVSAFVAGVNEGRSARGVLTDERPWDPWTPLLVFLSQQVLFANFPGALWRRRLRAAHGAAGLAAFTVAPAAAGSNAFGVTGARTTTGSPLVAGDPHRTFEAPNVYAQVRLACRDPRHPDGALDVAGYTFAGVPGVQHFAHAGGVAWAITNAMADCQGACLEHLELRDGRLWAAGPSGWEPCESRAEVVRVRGAEPVVVTVVVTPRGPVVVGEPADDVVISLRTPSAVLGDLGFGALLPLLRARTAADVDRAFDRWVEPVNNVVIADTTGDLRHRVAGRVPSGRAADVPLDAVGSGAEAAWTTWVDPLPRVPAVDGVVVTANDRATPQFDQIGRGFATDHRARRIRQLLTARADWTADDLRAVSLDVGVGGVDAVLAAVGGLDHLSGAAARLRERLAGWDRTMSPQSELAAAYAGLRDGLVEGMAASLPALGAPSPHGPLYAAWFLAGPRVLAALDTLLDGGAAALGIDVDVVARAALEQQAVRPPTPWGRRHRFHPLTATEQLGVDDPEGRLLGTARPAVTGSPVGGDDHCVAATHAVPGATDSTRGPVARYVWDLADRSRSHWGVPLGAAESGPHAEDQHAAWDSGELVPVVSDWALLRLDHRSGGGAASAGAGTAGTAGTGGTGGTGGTAETGGEADSAGAGDPGAAESVGGAFTDADGARGH